MRAGEDDVGFLSVRQYSTFATLIGELDGNGAPALDALGHHRNGFLDEKVAE